MSITSRLNDATDAAVARLEELETEIDNLADENNKLRDTIDEKDSEIEDLKDEIDELQKSQGFSANICFVKKEDVGEEQY